MKRQQPNAIRSAGSSRRADRAAAFHRRIHHLVRDCGNQLAKVLEMHIERSFRDTGLRNDIIDRDRFHGLPGEQRIRSGNELGASPRSLLAPDFGPADLDRLSP